MAGQAPCRARAPAGPAARRYLLAGLLACGRCGRKLESAWSDGKPAYRCRHGYTSATRPDLARPKSTYVREDQILPHLAAIAILMDRPSQTGSGTRRSLARVTTPARAADLIDSLRTAGVILTYDPGQQTLRCNEDIGVPGSGSCNCSTSMTGSAAAAGWPARRHG